MDDLETTLKKVEDLRRDLSAEIVVEEAVTHLGYLHEVPKGLRGDEGRHLSLEEIQYYQEQGEIVDRSAVMGPDMQKREAAKIQLQQVYNSSEWYSARFEARGALNINNKPLEDELKEWIQQLSDDLCAGEEREKWGQLPVSYTQYGPPLTEFFPDIETQNRAHKDLEHMYHHLQNKSMRILTGKTLGYSSIKIWFDELFR